MPGREISLIGEGPVITGNYVNRMTKTVYPIFIKIETGFFIF